MYISETTILEIERLRDETVNLTLDTYRDMQNISKVEIKSFNGDQITFRLSFLNGFWVETEIIPFDEDCDTFRNFALKLIKIFLDKTVIEVEKSDGQKSEMKLVEIINCAKERGYSPDEKSLDITDSDRNKIKCPFWVINFLNLKEKTE